MIKRAFDFFVSLVAILILSPLLVPIVIALRLTGEGEIFYRQERIGRGGKLFSILKFATMLKDSPNMSGGDITVGRDPRILPMGHFLRNTKINELPQLFNILNGTMSIIGPRPLTPRVAALFPAQHWKNVAALRPGLSGIGSIVFRDEEGLLNAVRNREAAYSQAIVPYKMALEDWYAKNQSLGLDIRLILATAIAVLAPGFRADDHFPGLPKAPDTLEALRRGEVHIYQ